MKQRNNNCIWTLITKEGFVAADLETGRPCAYYNREQARIMQRKFKLNWHFKTWVFKLNLKD